VGNSTMHKSGVEGVPTSTHTTNFSLLSRLVSPLSYIENDIFVISIVCGPLVYGQIASKFGM